MKLGIFQIYFKPDQVKRLDPAFIPVSNYGNTDTHLREWPIIANGIELAKQHDLDVWGFTSYKFNEKTNLIGKHFTDFIQDNADSGVWFMEPHARPRVPWLNGWHQGQIYHPGIMPLAQTVLKKIGYMTDISTQQMPSCWYNYFAFNRATWNLFLKTMSDIESVCRADGDLYNQMYVNSAGYEPALNVPFFIFFLERFVTTFLTENKLKYKVLNYNNKDFIFAQSSMT